MPEFYINGRLTGYRVVFEALGNRHLVVKNVSSTKFQKCVEDLSRENEYNISIAAKTGKGYSPVDSSLLVTTSKSGLHFFVHGLSYICFGLRDLYF